jgi:hypothetical protein
VLFDQAAEWLAYVMATPLGFLLKGIGSIAQKPAAAPRRFSTVVRHGITETLITGEAHAGPHSGVPGGSYEEGQPGSPKLSINTGGGDGGGTPTSARRRLSVSGRSVVRALTPVGAAEQENESLKMQLIVARGQIQQLKANEVASGGGDGGGSVGDFREELEDELEEHKSLLAAKEEHVVTLQSQLAELDLQLSLSRTGLDQERKQGEAEKEAMAQQGHTLAQELSQVREELEQATALAEKREAEVEVQQAALQKMQDAMSAGDEGGAALRAQMEEERVRLSNCVKTLEAEVALVTTQAQSNAQLAAAHKSQLDAVTQHLGDHKATLGRTDKEVASLKEQVASFQDTIKKKDGVLAIMQEQLVKMASEQMSKIDQSVLDATQAQRDADMRALADAQASADAAAKADLDAAAVAAAAAASATQMPGASSSWVQYVDDAGRPYYFNSVSEETSWEAPPGFEGAMHPGPAPATPTPGVGVDAAGSSGSALVRVGNHVQYFDDAGHPFWVNEVTGDSQWEPPAGYQPNGSSGPGDSASVDGYAIEL